MSAADATNILKVWTKYSPSLQWIITGRCQWELPCEDWDWDGDHLCEDNVESPALASGQGGAQAVSAWGHDHVLRHPGSGDPLQVRTRMGDYHIITWPCYICYMLQGALTSQHRWGQTSMNKHLNRYFCKKIHLYFLCSFIACIKMQECKDNE